MLLINICVKSFMEITESFQRAITKNTRTAVIVLMICTSSHVTFKNLCSFMKISPAFFKLQSGHKYITEIARFNVQRAVTHKLVNPSYCILHAA